MPSIYFPSTTNTSNIYQYSTGFIIFLRVAKIKLSPLKKLKSEAAERPILGKVIVWPSGIDLTFRRLSFFPDLIETLYTLETHNRPLSCDN